MRKCFSKTIWKELLTKEKDKEILYEFEEAKGTKAESEQRTIFWHARRK